MALELVGKIKEIMPEVNGQSERGPWVKQDFMIATEEQYSKDVVFSLWGDRASYR